MAPVSDEQRRRLIAQSTQAWAAPDVIDLGIGQPQDELLPLELLAVSAARHLNRGDRHGLQYGAEIGDGFFRLALGEFLAQHYGIEVDPEPIFTTNGNSQAIEMVCSVFADPEAVVFVEEPSYFLALDIFRDHRLKIVGIATDEHGLSIDALEQALTQHRPRLLYTIPAFQNPTGRTLPSPRRRRLVELAIEHNFLIVADEVYHLLNYSGLMPEPMAAHVDSGVVLSLGTFSKILAPGLRLGWIQGSRALTDRLAARGYLVSGGGLNPLTSAVVTEALNSGAASLYLASLRSILGERLNAMSVGVRRYLPDNVEFDQPTGGYFLWLRFAPDVDTAKFLEPAARHRVCFRAGHKFSFDGSLANYMRLSHAFYDRDDIEVGLIRLASALGEC